MESYLGRRGGCLTAFIPFLALVCAILISTTAEARKRNVTYELAPGCNVTMPCEGGYYTTNAKRFLNMPFGRAIQSYTPIVKSNRYVASSRSYAALGTGSIVSHPSGCPGRAFCGCGASVRIFGKPVRSLYLASNWLRFPRAHPAPGMVAARRGHVFVLERPLGDGTWMVYDANSGGHATRIHPRSLAGYAIVNPRA